ncbi:MAG: PQQ-binding-like beta-propeller repeat protein, partial [Caldiserica bacterium]|nr:PQQ-binding-like beta-propeller repeat protein [Caldisericota bacterium]
GKVFIAEDKKIIAVSENDGTKLWGKTLGFDSEFISSRGEYVSVANGKTVMFFNTEDGSLIKQLNIEQTVTQPPSFDSTQCYIVSSQGKKLECFNLKSGKSLWSVESQVPYYKPQVWKDGIIAPSLTCVQTRDRQTGKLLWDITVVGQLAAEPAAVNDYMIIPTSQRVYAFRNAGFEIQIGTSSLDLGIMTNDEPFSISKVQVFNYSGSKLDVSCQTLDPWLVVVPDKFEIGAHDSVDVSLSADMRSVDDGAYSSKIKINWPNGTREVAVAAKKVKPQEISKPKPGLLVIDKVKHDTSARLGQQNPVFQFTISNDGELEVDYSLSSISPWMLISSKTGTLRSKGSAKINVCLVTSLAMMGLNEGLIIIKSKTSQQMFEYYVRFWRDPGIETKVCEFDLGSSIATISGVKVRARPEPHIKNNIFMLPLNFIQLMLDCKLEKLNDKKYRLIRDNVSMILEIDSPTCEIFTPKGLNKLKLEAPVSLRSGLVAVPVTVLEEAYETKLTNKGNHYVFEIELPELE